jgi:hypothetical protein
MPRTSKYTELVRAAAVGRWTDILASVAGIPSEYLDGAHHPCPKCGGTDRFRLIDPETGAVLCNQCFSKKNGDGFAAIKWFFDYKKFPEAVAHVGKYLGIESTNGKNGQAAIDPAKDLDWRPWSSELVKFFLQAKPGISEPAILAAGGRMARYKQVNTVIAFPIIGESLDITKPVGWVLVNATGGTLPRWDKDGTPLDPVKVKVTYGSKPGLVGLHAIERMKAGGDVERNWKCEGVTDLLAVMTAVPPELADKHLVLTNSNGAGQRLNWMAGIVARFPSGVIHDADHPGQAGAAQACQDIALQGGQVRNVQLPYEVVADHGRDVRDWLVEGHSFADLLALADNSEPIAAPKSEDGEIDYSKVEFPIQQEILRKLQIEVLYESETGEIKIFSHLLWKCTTITSSAIDKLGHARLLQICGPPAMGVIADEPDGKTSWSLVDVRKAIALTASTKRESHDERGVGIWPAENSIIVVANNTSAARWNPSNKKLERVLVPRVDGLVLDFGSGNKDWFDFDELSRNVDQAADADWTASVMAELEQFLTRWRWKNPDHDPTLVTGLTLASFPQAAWHWRPLVIVIGQSNAGKTMLFEALGGHDQQLGIFGNLAFKSSRSTEAGIRQGLGKSAKIILDDEFEKSDDRERVLELLRASTRGDTITRGTSDQKGKKYRLCHLPWLAATEAGLHRQADINRFIQLDLLVAEAHLAGKLKLPKGDFLYRLGQRLLAIAIWCIDKARELAIDMKSEQVEGIDARTVESYAVPTAMLAVALRLNEAKSRELLRDLLSTVDKDEQGRTDHDDLLSDIMSALVNCPPKDGQLMVSQIIGSTSLWHEHADQLEAQGVTLKDEGAGRKLAVRHREVANKLLQKTHWAGQRIDQVLLRIKGAERAKAEFEGERQRAILIPLPE